MALVLSSLCSIANAEKPGQFILTFGSESTSMNESIKEFSIATEQSNSTNAPEIEFKITKVNDAKETTYYESTVSSLSDISVDVVPGTYKIYIQNLSDNNIQEYNNDSEGYTIGSEEIIPLEYKPAAGYRLDAPWRIEYSKDNISLLAIDYDLLAPDIKNISIYDANANDTFVQSTDWDVLQSISISSMPYFFHLTIDKNKFIIDSQNRIAVKIRFDLTGIYDDIQGPIYIYRAEKDLPKVRNWFYGDTHVHSNYTSNAWEFGAPVYATSKAVDAIGLNWVTITDHSFDQTNLSTKWNDYLRDCDADERCLRAEEVSCDWGFLNRYGHYLSYGNSNFIVGHEVYLGETKTCDEIVNLINTIGFGYVAHPMHSDIFRNFWQNFSLPVTGLEVWNGVGEPWETERDSALQKWVEQLSLGRKIFVEAGSDAHGDFNSALGKVRTACFAPTFTKDNIFAALKNGNCMMTDGPLVIFTANRHIIGESFNVSEGDTIALNISWNSTNEFGNVTEIILIRGEINGNETNETVLTPNNLSGNFLITSTPNNTYYRIEARSIGPDGKMRRAYTNPIWVYAEPRPEVEKIPMDESELALVARFENKYDYSLKDLFFDSWPLTDCNTESLRENLNLNGSWQVVKCEKMILDNKRLMWAGFNNTNTNGKKIVLQIDKILKFADADYNEHRHAWKGLYWIPATGNYLNYNWIAHKNGTIFFEMDEVHNSNAVNNWGGGSGDFGTYLIHGFRKYDGTTTAYYTYWHRISATQYNVNNVYMMFDNKTALPITEGTIMNTDGLLRKKSFNYNASSFGFGADGSYIYGYNTGWQLVSGTGFDQINRSVFSVSQSNSTVLCHADIDCNDGDLLTKDTCANACTTDSKCEHTPQEPEEPKKPFTEMDADEVSKAIDFKTKYNNSLGELYFDGWKNTTCNNAGILETLKLDKNWSVLQCQKFLINGTLAMFAGLNNTLTGEQYAAYQLEGVLVDENASYRKSAEKYYSVPGENYILFDWDRWTAIHDNAERFEINYFIARGCGYYGCGIPGPYATYIIHGFNIDGNKNTALAYSFNKSAGGALLRITFDNYRNFSIEDTIPPDESIYKRNTFEYRAFKGWALLSYQINNRSLFPTYRANDLIIGLESPAHLRAADRQGRITGYSNGTYLTQIPNSEILDREHEKYLLPANETYRFFVDGYECGNYSLKITRASGENSCAVYFRNISATNETRDTFELNGTASISVKTNDSEKNITAVLDGIRGSSESKEFTAAKNKSVSIYVSNWSALNESATITEYINYAPEIISIRPNNGSSFGQWQPISLGMYATDQNNDSLEYVISFDGTELARANETTYTLNESGTHTINFGASDGLNTVSEEIVIYVIAPPTVPKNGENQKKESGGGSSGGGAPNQTLSKNSTKNISLSAPEIPKINGAQKAENRPEQTKETAPRSNLSGNSTRQMRENKADTAGMPAGFLLSNISTLAAKIQILLIKILHIFGI